MEKQYLEEDYLYEDEDALAELEDIRMEIDYARKHGDIERALELYHEYVREDILNFSSYKAFKILPEYIEYYDTHNQYKEHKYYVMWAFKMILPVLDGFFELSLDDIKKYYDLYRNCCKKYGYSLRTYYQILEYYLYSNPNALAVFGISVAEAHEMAKKEPRDRLCDPEAVEAYNEFTYYLDIEDNDISALEIIAPYLEIENRYGSVPHQSYYYLARYYSNKGQIGKSIQYAKKALVMLETDYPDHLCFFYIRSILLDIISVRYKQKAIRVFKEMLKCVENCQSEAVVFTFFECSYRLFYRLEKADIETVSVSIPKSLGCTLSASYNAYQTKDLKQFFYGKAKILADRFDSHNQTNEFNDSLNEEPVLEE